ncbi:MAG: hypothetical protein JW797_09025 [Bradymonadales bacterium]|nr:hypothetical protein [Bradymonadales bacterium]
MPPHLLVSIAIGLGLACLAGAGWWYWRRRIDRLQMAAKVDRAFGLKDLLTTALAVDNGTARVDPVVGTAVIDQAVQLSDRLDPVSIGPFCWPKWSPLIASASASLAIIFVVLAGSSHPMWPPPAIASMTGDEEASEASRSAQATDPPLSQESVEALRWDLERLERLRERMAADRVARELADRISGSIRSVTGPTGNASQRIGALSAAERHLQELSRRGGGDGSLMDEGGLALASHEELIEALRQSISQGDAFSAAELVAELARRTADSDRGELAGLGAAVLRSEPEITESVEPYDNPTMSGEERQAANQQLTSAGREMSAANRGGALSELTRLMEQLEQQADQNANPSRQVVEQALYDVRQAREEQLHALNQSRESRQQALSQAQQRSLGERRNTNPRSGQMGMDRQQERNRPADSCATEGQQGVACSGQQSGESSRLGLQARQGDRSDGRQVMEIWGPWGTGGVNRGPGQGPTPRPWEGLLPPFEMPSAQWIESQWETGHQGLIEMIEGASHGERSALRYQEVLFNYSSLAESVARQEEIPLTRRRYIQRYFEAIRP